PPPVFFQTIHTVARQFYFFYILCKVVFIDVANKITRITCRRGKLAWKRVGCDCTLRLIQNKKSKKAQPTIPILMKLINNFALSVYFTGRPTHFIKQA
ncbi:hypothetical protein SEEM460_05730, partial [Salmonella enterica subsp. enterica serovar Montevideo str. 609460]